VGERHGVVLQDHVDVRYLARDLVQNAFASRTVLSRCGPVDAAVKSRNVVNETETTGFAADADDMRGWPFT
jgi:hypothetical protein